MNELKDGPLPRSYFWVKGVVPVVVGIVMVLFPVFVPPPPGLYALAVLAALIPLIYGVAEIRHYWWRRA